MVPAFSFIKGVKEQGEVLDVWLWVAVTPQGSRLTNHKGTNQTGVKVSLLFGTNKLSEYVCFMNLFLCK